VKLITGAFGDALPVKPREQRRRAGPVETFVVIENANPQTGTPPHPKNEYPELLRIKGLAACVKAEPVSWCARAGKTVRL
jgi:hypothetical protein